MRLEVFNRDVIPCFVSHNIHHLKTAQGDKIEEILILSLLWSCRLPTETGVLE